MMQKCISPIDDCDNQVTPREERHIMFCRLAVVSALLVGMSMLNTDTSFAKGPKGKGRGRGGGAIHVGKGFDRGYYRPHSRGDDLLFMGANFLPWLHGHDTYSYGPQIRHAPVDYYSNTPFGDNIMPQRFIQPPNDVVPYHRETEDAFRAGQYESAVRLAKHALIENPKHGRFHELLSQALFAVGDYRGAAAALSQATSLTAVDDWGFVVRNHARYYRGHDYAEQMGRLSRFIDEYPESADAWLVRGYHHGFLGHKDAAWRDLAKVSQLGGHYQLANRLRVRFGMPADSQEIEQLPPPLLRVGNGR
jgi:hypothetical protein